MQSRSYCKVGGLFPRRGKPSCFFNGEAGNVLFYVFLAVGLLGALTYSFVKDSRENVTSQTAARMAEEIFVQQNMIRSGIMQCAMEYPQGGGDLDSDNDIDSDDNPNTPYPVDPSDDIGAASNADVRDLTCPGAPSGEENMFQSANNQGKFLPPPLPGFTEWSYYNDANGVYIQTTAPADGASVEALTRFMTKFTTCQAELNYGACGARCLTVWIKCNACP